MPPYEVIAGSTFAIAIAALCVKFVLDQNKRQSEVIDTQLVNCIDAWHTMSKTLEKLTSVIEKLTDEIHTRNR